jgi:tRNA dimethylallyltransferase
MMAERPKVVVIAGPTASGKTALGVKLALAFGGEIISADSMQVYRGMDVGTAKPTLEEQGGVPHYLLDVVDPDQEFNAATYRSLALPKIRDIAARGRACFVVGGTGLYIKSLLGGLFRCPPKDPAFREELKQEADARSSHFLHQRLAELDPESAGRIHPNDGMRIIRALEVIHLSRQRASDLSKAHGFADREIHALKFCLEVDRQTLYDRIDRRSLVMMDAGLVQETRDLLDKGYRPDLKPMKAIGYRHMVRYLQGEWSLEEAVRGLQRDTRRYAKRQLTWFRADPEIRWINPEDLSTLMGEASAFLTPGA